MSRKTTSRSKKSKKLQPNKQIQDAVTQLVLGLVTGTKDEITVPIDLKLPRALFQTYQEAAKQWQVPVEDLLQQSVIHGMQIVMSSNAVVRNPLEVAEVGGLDTSNIKEGLSKVAGLVQELNELQRQADALTGTDTENPS